MITFITAIIAFWIGALTAWHIAGNIAYDEGVRDEKQHWYIHAHDWGCDAEAYKDNE